MRVMLNGGKGEMRVMAIDPGGTVGIVCALIDGGRDYVNSMTMIKATMTTKQLGTPQEDFAALRLFDEIVKWNPDVLVMEDFRLFPDVAHHLDPAGTLPDRYLARIDLLLHMWREYGIVCAPIGHVSTLMPQAESPRVMKQMPGERTVITDSWLRAEGLWRTEKRQGGGPHSMDALRHLVVFTRKWCQGKVKMT